MKSTKGLEKIERNCINMLTTKISRFENIGKTMIFGKWLIVINQRLIVVRKYCTVIVTAGF